MKNSHNISPQFKQIWRSKAVTFIMELTLAFLVLKRYDTPLCVYSFQMTRAKYLAKNLYLFWPLEEEKSCSLVWFKVFQLRKIFLQLSTP